MAGSVPPEPAYAPPGPDSAPVLHVDDAILVAIKPAGLLSVPGRGTAKQASLLTYLLARYPGLEAVHRLDMDTSGLIVFARGKASARALGKAFAEQAVTKTYHARVAGQPCTDTGRIDLPIGRDWNDRPLRRISRKTGQAALTDWWLETGDEETSLLRLMPRTGRTHQLRLHLAAIGHPILGDRFYGRADSASRLYLHASKLGLTHPGTGIAMDFSAPPPFA